MIKTLIATALLSLGVSAPTVQTPRKLYGQNTIYGAYCFRDSILTDTWVEADETYFIYDYQVASDLDYFQIGKILVINNNGIQGYTNIYDFYIEVINDNEFMVDISYLNGTYQMDYTNIYDYDIAELPYYMNELILYFPVPVFLSQNAYNIFNAIFTQQGNSYVTYYNGYYNLNNNLSANRTWSVYGQFLVDNNIYALLQRGGNNTITAQGIGSSLTVYEGGAIKVKNRNILINGTLINNRVYNNMSLDGNFAYIKPTEEYSFGELIFSVMDAPLYFLTSLFSFELFGIQFYVAFMSIVTLLLICVVIRKII